MKSGRIAFNFVLGVFIYGALIATIAIFIPALLTYSILYGWPPPSPSNLALRIIQIAEAYVMCHAGCIIMRKVMRNRITKNNHKRVRAWH